MENGWNLEDSYGQVIAQTQQCRVTQNEADRKTAYLLFPWKTFFFLSTVSEWAPSPWNQTSFFCPDF